MERLEILKRRYLFGAGNIATIAVHLGTTINISGWNESDYTLSVIHHYFVSLHAVASIFLGCISAVWSANERCFHLHGL